MAGKAEEISLAFCNPIHCTDDSFGLNEKLSIQEIGKRLLWEEDEINEYISSIGYDNKYLKILTKNNKKMVCLKKEGKDFINGRINTFQEELDHLINHFNELYNNNKDNNDFIYNSNTNDDCICSTKLKTSIPYFPYIPYLIYSIICFTHLKNYVNKKVNLKKILKFLNNENIFSKDNRKYFNYIINNVCHGLEKFLKLPMCKAFFDVNDKEEVTLHDTVISNDPIPPKNTNKNDKVIEQIQIDLFHYLLTKSEKYNEITEEELSNIINKDKQNSSIKNIVDKVLNHQQNYFIKDKNTYTVNMDIYESFKNNHFSSNDKKKTKKGKYSYGKSFISQCIWLHPNYEKCLFIIIDYLKMNQLINYINVPINTVYQWLTEHYSWNPSEKEEIGKLLHRCKGIKNFLAFKIHSKYFKIQSISDTDCVILNRNGYDREKNLKLLYRKYQLEDQFHIDDHLFSNDYKKSNEKSILYLRYSYLSLKNFPELGDDHKLKIFINFFVACINDLSLSFCNVDNLLTQIEKYHIPLQEYNVNYLTKFLRGDKHYTIKNYNDIDNSKTVLFCFEREEKNVFNVRKTKKESPKNNNDKQDNTIKYKGSSDKLNNKMKQKNSSDKLDKMVKYKNDYKNQDNKVKYKNSTDNLVNTAKYINGNNNQDNTVKYKNYTGKQDNMVKYKSSNDNFNNKVKYRSSNESLNNTVKYKNSKDKFDNAGKYKGNNSYQDNTWKSQDTNDDQDNTVKYKNNNYKQNNGKIFNKEEENDFELLENEYEFINIMKDLKKSYKDAILLILILNYIYVYGRYFDDKHNFNKFVYLKDVEKYINKYQMIEDLKLFIEKYNDSLVILPGDRHKYGEDIVTFTTEKMISDEIPTEIANKKSVLAILNRNLIIAFKSKIKNIHYSSGINDLSRYIKFYPFMEKFKNIIIEYLSNNTNTIDQNNRIKSYLEINASSEEELRLLKYYIGCCHGIYNIIHNLDILKTKKEDKSAPKSKSYSFKEKESTLHISIREKYKKLNDEILNEIKRLLPTDNDFQRLKLLKNKITNIIMNRWSKNDLELHLFGSSTNGLWVRGSDVDLCIFADTDDNYNKMSTLANVLREKNMKRVIPIENARIPICKFKDPSTGLNCDLSVNNRIATYNSELIRRYTELDQRVRDIIMIVKKWAKCRGINDSKNHYFSSYSFVLLCISFFQNIEPPVIPNLQNMKNFPALSMTERTVDVSKKILNGKGKGTLPIRIKYYNNDNILNYYKTKNTMSRSELLIKLFEYYSQHYDYKNTVCSIRSDRGILKTNSFKTKFAIEDPFIHKRNTTSNSREKEKQRIIDEFDRAYNILKSPNSSLNDLFKN